MGESISVSVSGCKCHKKTSFDGDSLKLEHACVISSLKTKQVVATTTTFGHIRLLDVVSERESVNVRARKKSALFFCKPRQDNAGEQEKKDIFLPWMYSIRP